MLRKTSAAIVDYVEVGIEIAQYLKASNPNLRQIQALLRDLLAGDELLLPMQDVALRYSVFTRQNFDHSDSIRIERDDLLQELSSRYIPQVVDQINELLNGMVCELSNNIGTQQNNPDNKFFDRKSLSHPLPLEPLKSLTPIYSPKSSEDEPELYHLSSAKVIPLSKKQDQIRILYLFILFLPFFGYFAFNILSPDNFSTFGSHGLAVLRCLSWYNKDYLTMKICGKSALLAKDFVLAERFFNNAINGTAGYEGTELLWYRAQALWSLGQNKHACDDYNSVVSRQYKLPYRYQAMYQNLTYLAEKRFQERCS